MIIWLCNIRCVILEGNHLYYFLIIKLDFFIQWKIKNGWIWAHFFSNGTLHDWQCNYQCKLFDMPSNTQNRTSILFMYRAVGFVTTCFSATHEIFTGSRKIPLNLIFVKRDMHIRDIQAFHGKVGEINVSITWRVQLHFYRSSWTERTFFIWKTLKICLL